MSDERRIIRDAIRDLNLRDSQRQRRQSLARTFQGLLRTALNNTVAKFNGTPFSLQLAHDSVLRASLRRASGEGPLASLAVSHRSVDGYFIVSLNGEVIATADPTTITNQQDADDMVEAWFVTALDSIWSDENLPAATPQSP